MGHCCLCSWRGEGWENSWEGNREKVVDCIIGEEGEQVVEGV